MAKWRDINPTGAIADFLLVWREAGPRRWPVAAAAAATTLAMFSLIWRDEYRIPPRPPEIIYINSWRADRSDAEIRASNLVNQQRKDRLAIEQARRDEEVRHIYKTIGRLSGMDVDAIERQAKADEAAAARAAVARQRQLMQNGPPIAGSPAPNAR
jgi:hypothetical protein